MRRSSMKSLQIVFGFLVLFLWTSAAGPVLAESADTDSVAFDIAAQMLPEALEAFSAASGKQVLYVSEIAMGKRARPVKGIYRPAEALAHLVAGTGLDVRRTAADDFVLIEPGRDMAAFAKARAEASAAGPVLSLPALQVRREGVGPSALRVYGGVVQMDVRKALERHEKTKSGNYRVGARLWIGPSGAVGRAEIFEETGNTERDAAIRDVLAELTISQPPPAGLPQPVSIKVMVHSL